MGSDDPWIRGEGGSGPPGSPGVAEKKKAFLDAQVAEMPSPAVRLTAGRHEKAKKKRRSVDNYSII